MSKMTPQERERLLELLADEQLDQLTPEDRADLEQLLARTDNPHEMETLLGDALVALDRAMGGPEMPSHVAAALVARGCSIVRKSSNASGVRPRNLWRWLAMAAALAITAGAGFLTLSARQQARTATQQLTSIRERIAQNEQLLANARARADELAATIERRGETITEQERQLADAMSREVELAAQLAEATSNLDRANLKIARYEEPVDPATLQQNRTKLLDVPGTVRLAWSPFELPDAPAPVKRNVTGDVVWNDDLEQGYLRFVGLDPNDPAIEQYQVWIIDERGMEQKVSGGVFNVTAQGEVIVPIEPGIDVGRVALFAITVEDPGGTWVPDLRRRVVLAPRG